MNKDFYAWHGVKIEIQSGEKRWFCDERQVRWCSIGLNIGSEMDGKGENYTRPVLVLKKITWNTCLCVPLTTQNQERIYHANVDLRDGVPRKAILSQIRLIDTKRLRGIVGTVDLEQFQEIKKAIINIFE
jgi:mRNA interferase MazF